MVTFYFTFAYDTGPPRRYQWPLDIESEAAEQCRPHAPRKASIRQRRSPSTALAEGRPGGAAHWLWSVGQPSPTLIHPATELRKTRNAAADTPSLEKGL